MTNKQRYRRAFSALHASRSSLMEVKHMKQKTHLARPAVVCALVAMAIGLTSVAYAADVGGIRRSIQFFLNGQRTDATLDIEDGSYTLTWEDENGVSHERGGGGVAYEADGTERPLTEEEIVEQLNFPEAECRDDGSIWLWYRETGLDITDKFGEDGLCQVELDTGDGPLYVTVNRQGGLSCSAEGYVRVDLK